MSNKRDSFIESMFQESENWLQGALFKPAQLTRGDTFAGFSVCLWNYEKLQNVTVSKDTKKMGNRIIGGRDNKLNKALYHFSNSTGQLQR